MNRKFYDYELDRIEYIFPCDEKHMLEMFEQYNFKDELGHPLTRCIPFLKLIRFYYNFAKTQKYIKLHEAANG